MNPEEAKKTALNILDDSKIGVLATVKDDRPHSRYMTFFHQGGNLYTATSRKTQKVDELEQNPHAHILLGYEGGGFGDVYLEIEGRIAEHEDRDILHQLWNESLEGWFSGPDDEDLVMLIVNPERARLMNKKGGEPQNIDL